MNNRALNNCCRVSDGAAWLRRRTPQRTTKRLFIEPKMTDLVTGTEVFTNVLQHGHSLGTSLSFPRWRIALFSRSSICPLLGCTRLFSIALTTVTTGTAYPLAQESGRELKNFLASHSPGRDSCLSHSRTLGDRKVEEEMVCAFGPCGILQIEPCSRNLSTEAQPPRHLYLEMALM